MKYVKSQVGFPINPLTGTCKCMYYTLDTCTTVTNESPASIIYKYWDKNILEYIVDNNMLKLPQTSLIFFFIKVFIWGMVIGWVCIAVLTRWKDSWILSFHHWMKRSMQWQQQLNRPFANMAAILNKFDSRSIMRCPGSISKSITYSLSIKNMVFHCIIVSWEKKRSLLLPNMDSTTIFFLITVLLYENFTKKCPKKWL